MGDGHLPVLDTEQAGIELPPALLSVLRNRDTAHCHLNWTFRLREESTVLVLRWEKEAPKHKKVKTRATKKRMGSAEFPAGPTNAQRTSKKRKEAETAATRTRHVQKQPTALFRATDQSGKCESELPSRTTAEVTVTAAAPVTTGPKRKTPCRIRHDLQRWQVWRAKIAEKQRQRDLPAVSPTLAITVSETEPSAMETSLPPPLAVGTSNTTARTAPMYRPAPPSAADYEELGLLELAGENHPTHYESPNASPMQTDTPVTTQSSTTAAPAANQRPFSGPPKTAFSFSGPPVMPPAPPAPAAIPKKTRGYHQTAKQPTARRGGGIRKGDWFLQDMTKFHLFRPSYNVLACCTYQGDEREGDIIDTRITPYSITEGEFDKWCPNRSRDRVKHLTLGSSVHSVYKHLEELIEDTIATTNATQ